ncbi:MAG: MOSC domain-containing protein [Actinomycetes bacterium]
MASVVSLNVVHVTIPDVGGSVGITAIDKRAVTDSRLVTTDGVAGDKRCDTESHGHPDQAVYAYSKEDYSWWESQLGMQLAPGVFGDNLTTQGIDWTTIPAGTILRVGNATLQVTYPRIPCGTFTRWLELEHWVKRFTDAGRSGAYLRVLEPGEITHGDEITIVERPTHDVTIQDLFEVYNGSRDHDQLQRVVQCADTSEKIREKARKALSLQ